MSCRLTDILHGLSNGRQRWVTESGFWDVVIPNNQTSSGTVKFYFMQGTDCAFCNSIIMCKYCGEGLFSV